jgi:hypothetical protein
MSKRTFAFLLILSLFVSLHAAAARPGWTKIELTAGDGRGVPADLLTRFGAELVADYGSYSIVSVPAGMAEALRAAAGEKKVRVRARDDLDMLLLPGAAVDAREGLRGVAAQKLISQYPAGKPGVFVLQFVAPPRKEWVDGLNAHGWKVAQYVPNDGYLIVGPPELAAKTRQLPYVQWLDFYHPYQKAAILSGDGALHELLFELPPGAASEEGVEAIRAAAGTIAVERGSLDTIVTARLTEAAAVALLRHPMILAIEVKQEFPFADGRQAQSLSPLLNSTQTQPTTNVDYWNWVLSKCAECANMTASVWRVGVADTGLDNGFGQFGHPDLAGRKFFGIIGYDPNTTPADTCPQGQELCDKYRHGTLVSGVVAGGAATGVRDSLGFLVGLGGAPTAGIYMTKIGTAATGGGDPNRLFFWTTDAVNAGVTVQNHSYGNLIGGTYDVLSRKYDSAALDADDVASPARPQLLMTIAAGNRVPMSNDFTSTLGMAKNVLTLGGLENYRPDADSLSCSRSAADSFKNIMSFSKTGNSIPGYFKPDLMAPASAILSTETSMIWPDDAYCLRNYTGDPRYSGDTGTSFAAPLAAAASIVVKRYLGNAPTDTSPALVKAALIAGAHSVRGGEDRTKNPVVLVGAAPNQQQGFGRLTLEDILNGSQKPVFFDQSPSRTFTTAGQTFCTRLQIHDSTKPVKIALVWSDTPAMAGAANPLVNDLNLEVRRASNPSSVYIGNSLAVTANDEESIAYPSGATLPVDNVNNVEYFRSFMNANEQFSITVKAWNIAGDTDGNPATNEQNFALVILNADLVSVGACDTPPSAVFTITCADLTCTADASASSDDFGITNYSWNWGDSSTTNTAGPITSHTYAGPGTFSVILTTRDTASQSTASTPHVISACNPPTIVTQPASQTITPSSTATLSVVAGGSGPFSYQWFEGPSGTTTTQVGTNSNTFTTPPLTATKSYWVRVTSTCNTPHTVDSNTATITVVCTAPPTITAQPTSRTITAPQSTTLSVTATQVVTCQWYVGTAPSTTTPITPTACSIVVTPSVSTNYFVRVSNACGLIDSNTIAVTVCNPVGIATQPGSTTIPQNSTATLTVVASGSGPFSYQWYEGQSGATGMPVGTNSPSFTTPPLTTNKSYWVRVTSTCNGTTSVDSVTATVTVLCTVPPSITVQPASVTINAGQSTTLNVTANSAGSTTYQWFQGAAPSMTTPVGTNSSSYTTPALSSTTSYWVKVSNGCGSVNSNTATVTVCAPPSIVTQPASTTITTGSTATLSVVAGGSGPLAYQWYEGASGVTTTPVGTNSSSFTTPALTATKSYWVRVTSTCNGSASANSNTATVTVVPPQITRRQTAAGSAWSQRTVAANWPQPTQAGNLLVAVVSGVTEPTFTWTPPAGWVQAQTYEWNDIKTSIYYIANNGGGRTSETFTVSSGFHDQTLDLLEYSGVALTNPLDKTAFNGAFSNTNGYIDTGYTAQASQLKEVAIGALTTFFVTTISNPSDGFTELDDQTIGNSLTTAVFERNTTTAGHMGVSAAVGGNQQWVGMVVTFRSADPN